MQFNANSEAVQFNDNLNDCRDGVNAVRALSTILVQVLFRGDADCLGQEEINGLSTLFRHQLDAIDGGLTVIGEAGKAVSAEEATREKLRGMMRGSKSISDMMAEHAAAGARQANHVDLVAELTGIERGLVAKVVTTLCHVTDGRMVDLAAFNAEFGSQVAPANAGGRRGNVA